MYQIYGLEIPHRADQFWALANLDGGEKTIMVKIRVTKEIGSRRVS